MDQLRALRVFSRVVAEGSFAGAARALDMAPAVVTRALAELEQHLGARLLNRTTRTLALTDTGQAYLAQARSVLAALDDADALAGAAVSSPRGTLRVLCPPTFAVHQLAQHLPRFHALYPHLKLELSTPGAVEVADENFDVSILSIGQQPLHGGFVVRLLARSSFIVCAAPSYLNKFGRPQVPDDLLQHAGLLPAVSALRRELTLYPEASGDAGRTVTLALPAPVLSASHLDMLLASALAGLGLAGLPSFVAAPALKDGRLERVLPGWRGASLALYAAMPTRKHVPARTRAFMDFLVQAFGGVDTDPWLIRQG